MHDESRLQAGGLIRLLEEFREPEPNAKTSPPNTHWQQLAAVGLAGSAVYGVAAALHGGLALQMLSSMVKVPVLLFATALLCFPAFFVVQYAFSPRPLNLAAAAALQARALAITGLSWAVVSLPLAVILASARSYVAAKLLVTAVGAMGGSLGISFLLRGFRAATSTEQRKVRHWILTSYGVLFGLVGSQLAWNLRPFVGGEGEEFVLLRALGGSLIEHLWTLLT